MEIWAAASIAKAFDKAGVAYPQTEKGAPSFTKSFLTDNDHELPQLIMKARNLNKIQGTFIDSILRYVHKGKIHSHINQVRSDDGGTISGRISMANPNLQQLPSRDPELGPMIRRLFLPNTPEEKWAAIDFSQQEPRILVHYSKVFSTYMGQEMPGVEEFVDMYTNDPDADFHTMVSAMAGIPRKEGKVISLALLYGMGVKKLAVQLGVSEESAKKLTQTYHEKVPFVKMLTKGVQQRLDDPRSSGALRSLKGRKCRFELWEPATFDMHKALPREEAIAAHGPTTRLKRAYTWKSLNRIIQASAADFTKQAMVDVCEVGEIPMVQVHDELAFSVKDEAHAKKLAHMMENAVKLAVPSRCDIEMGPTWGDAVEIS